MGVNQPRFPQERWGTPTLWQWQGVAGWAQSLIANGATPESGVDIVVMTLNKETTLVPGTADLYAAMGLKVRGAACMGACLCVGSKRASWLIGACMCVRMCVCLPGG